MIQCKINSYSREASILLVFQRGGSRRSEFLQAIQINKENDKRQGNNLHISVFWKYTQIGEEDSLENYQVGDELAWGFESLYFRKLQRNNLQIPVFWKCTPNW